MLRASLLVLSALLLPACATKLEVPQYRNPPPAEAFSAFGRFELKSVEMAPEYYGPSLNYRAARRIQGHFDERLRPMLEEWTRKADRKATRTLLIEPRIESIKYVSTAYRILTGPYYGDSAVAMKLKYIDGSNGKLIAEPQFFQDTGAWWGFVTFGTQDNWMLKRLVGVISEYTSANYSKPVGGRTGPDHAPLRPEELPQKN